MLGTARPRGAAGICYADGASQWDLAWHSEVLLAGAERVLDSAAGDFSVRLTTLLSDFLNAWTRQRAEEDHLKKLMREEGIVAESPLMLALFQKVVRISLVSDLPVLLTGESGAGKELMARAIHRLDRKRSRGPFVAINCNAVSHSLSESELFGHRRGAFTGAERDRPGLIRAADGGVLFLDEVGDLELSLQGKLLRVLQDNRVIGLGEDRETAVDIRVIAATNRDLRTMTRARTFREDLFHRLNVVSLHVPALRERPEDLRPLVEHMVRAHSVLAATPVPPVGEDFLDALRRIELPGNVRQLENLVRQTLVKRTPERREPLGLSDLPEEVWAMLVRPTDTGEDKDTPPPAGDAAGKTDVREILRLMSVQRGSLAGLLAHCERVVLEETLDRTGGNQSETARLLGITPRSVYNKIRKYGLLAS